MSEFFYAGYGSNRDPAMIRAITGETARLVDTVEILEHNLWVQRMDQTPSTPVAEGAPTVREILVGNWGPEGQAHGIRPNIGTVVVGSLFVVSKEALDLLGNWELVPSWKRRQHVSVRSRSGRGELTAMAEILPDDQPTVKQINGRVYKTHLRDPEALYRAAEAARLDYLLDRSPD